MNEQEMQDTADRIGDEVKAQAEGHWHMAHLKDGEENTNIAITGEPKEVMETMAECLMVCYRQSLKDLKRLADEFLPDASDVGLAYTRWSYLDRLTDALDPKLFDHSMFKLNANMDSLVEAVTDTLKSIGVIEVTGDVSLQVIFCEEQCQELTELQEAKQRRGHGGQHKYFFQGNDRAVIGIEAALEYMYVKWAEVLHIGPPEAG